MIKNQIFNARNLAYKTPYGAVCVGEELRFCLRPLRTEGVYEASLLIAEDGNDAALQSIPLCWRGIEAGCDCYEGTFSAPNAELYWYSFFIRTAQGDFYINHGKDGQGAVAETVGARFQLTVYDGAYQVPRWFGEGITYNIFPDRFHRTAVPEQSGYRAARRVHTNWDDVPEYHPDEHGEILNNDFFGGNLAGITEKLDYLKELQVTTLYLNPIFEAFSNHRYDTGDYKKIDPMLGTEEDFCALCREAAARGMRVVLDGVFNHTGFDSLYFNGRGNYDSVGAYQSMESPYHDWYDFQEWPNRYASWWGIYTLPQIRENSPDYQDYIIENEDSVIRHWIKCGASGWRLDVADELPDWFIQKLNTAVKETREDGLVLGEVWEDSSNKIAYGERRRYFQGGELDSVMNYPLREAILNFLTGEPAECFMSRIETLRENYPEDVFYNLMNIIGTHDTPRILSLLGGEPEVWQHDRDYRAAHKLTAEALENAKTRLRIAATLQFTMPGSPCVYYGDEVGMQGYEDPLNRRTFPWGQEEEEVLSFYRLLCKIREESDALRHGRLLFWKADGGVLLYARRAAQECIAVAVNRATAEAEIILPCRAAIDRLDNEKIYVAEEEGRTKIVIKAQSAMILRCEEAVDL